MSSFVDEEIEAAAASSVGPVTGLERDATQVHLLKEERKAIAGKISPMEQGLIEKLLSVDRTSVPVEGGYVAELQTKSTRKAVGMKRLWSIIQEEAGESATARIKRAADASRGEPKIKYSLKFKQAE